MFKNICLIGLPYSGKSRLGKQISKNTSKDFIEVDNIISNKLNNNLQNIININGCKYFLNKENEIGKKIECKNTIISPGGSMIYNKESIDHFKTNLNCKIIHLYLTYPEFINRIDNFHNRGIINPWNLSLNELYIERIRLCENYKDITILADDHKKAYSDILNIINI